MRKRIWGFLSKVDKRQRLVFSVGIVFVGNLLLTLLPLQTALWFIPLDIILVYIATYLALLHDIEHIEWVVLFILPVYLAVSLVLFYYLLPVHWLTRIPYLVVLSITLYASILSENIFNVGVEKSLPLYRAAYSVANFLTLLASFLIFTVLYSFRFNFLVNAFLGLLVAWPLFFHSVWSANPKAVLEERVYKFATINTALLAAAILLLNFVPIKTNIFALYTVTIFYLLSGLTQEIINDTVFRERVREYLIVFGVLSVLVLLSASWG
jgi:hypothetical protein